MLKLLVTCGLLSIAAAENVIFSFFKSQVLLKSAANQTCSTSDIQKLALSKLHGDKFECTEGYLKWSCFVENSGFKCDVQGTFEQKKAVVSARSKGATVSSSGEYGSIYNTKNGFLNNTQGAWCSAVQDNNQFFQYTFKNVETILEV